MVNNTPFISIDPDENYFEAFDSSNLNMCKYFSYKDYHDLFDHHDAVYFSLINYNIRNFSANSETIFGMFDSMGSYPDILALTETWYKSEDIQFLTGYDGYHTTRSIRRSGGVCLRKSKYFFSNKK